MALSPEEVATLKKQLSDQIQHLPSDQKAEAQKEIDKMPSEAIEDLLRQQQSQAQSQPIFRMIIEGKIPSKIVAENEFAIAVLSTKAISKGHTVIIPKSPADKSHKIPDVAFSLARQVSEKIIEVLKAEGTEIQTQFMFGELVIHVIPIYDKPLSINSEAKDADPKELEELSQKLYIPKEKPKPKVVVQEKPKEKVEKKELPKINRRIP